MQRIRGYEAIVTAQYLSRRSLLFHELETEIEPIHELGK